MFGLETRHIEFIINTLKKYISDDGAKFYIFGSRAKGDFREYSDVDIAVDLNGKKMPVSVLGKILSEFEDSTLPYEVDVVDLNSIDDNFKSLIKDSLVKL